MKIKFLIFLIMMPVVLSIIPLPYSLIAYSPNWFLISTLVFMYRWPLTFGIIGAFLMGIAQDIFSQNIIGTETLLFLFIAYFFRYSIWYITISNTFVRISTFFITLLSYEFLKGLLWWLLFSIKWDNIQPVSVMVASLAGTVIILILGKLAKD